MRLLLLLWIGLVFSTSVVSSKRPRREENSTFVEDPHHEASDLHELESDTLEIEAEEKESRGRLHEKHNDSLEDTEESPASNGGKDDYCSKYKQHYQYYCLGDAEAETAAKFCPAYQKACGVSGGVVAKPSNPFGRVHTPARSPVESESFEEEGASDEVEDKQQAYYTELKKRFPCKPDCDHRIFPHCTTECKCDYIYPSVQRFCNPPPMPMFLNTCRLWYNGCPQYDKYHYASQFVYSKAEKNKVAPGPQTNNPNPYNIPTTGKARQAGVPQIAAVEDNLIIPPNLPQYIRHKRNAQYSSRVRRQEDNTASEILRQYEQTGYLAEGEPIQSEEESGQEGAVKSRREIAAEPEATTRPFQMLKAKGLKSVSLTEPRYVSEIVEAPRARLHAFQFQEN